MLKLDILREVYLFLFPFDFSFINILSGISVRYEFFKHILRYPNLNKPNLTNPT